jgi:hypothetical protein
VPDILRNLTGSLPSSEPLAIVQGSRTLVASCFSRYGPAVQSRTPGGRIRDRFGWETVEYRSALSLARSVPDEFQELAEKDL